MYRDLITIAHRELLGEIEENDFYSGNRKEGIIMKFIRSVRGPNAKDSALFLFNNYIGALLLETASKQTVEGISKIKHYKDFDGQNLIADSKTAEDLEMFYIRISIEAASRKAKLGNELEQACTYIQEEYLLDTNPIHSFDKTAQDINKRLTSIMRKEAIDPVTHLAEYARKQPDSAVA